MRLAYLHFANGDIEDLALCKVTDLLGFKTKLFFKDAVPGSILNPISPPKVFYFKKCKIRCSSILPLYRLVLDSSAEDDFSTWLKAQEFILMQLQVASLSLS